VSGGLAFRLAGPDDAADVSALVELAYRGPASATGWTTEAFLLEGPRSDVEEIRRLIGDPAFRFVLGEAGDALVGCALVQRLDEETAHFGMFAVDPERQAGGVGRAVLGKCERTVRELWSTRVMTLTVISVRSELIDWYVRRGYRHTGVHLPFPFEAARGALREDFDLVQLAKVLDQSR
jgi:GNAT superfamily N-acetyltransferase